MIGVAIIEMNLDQAIASVYVNYLVRTACEYEHIKLPFNIIVIILISNRKFSKSKNLDVNQN